MPNPLVSIIMPCYKQAHYLREAIDSVFAQTYAPLELIVVNDGSPDDTETVARSYGDRLRYVWRNNGGLSAARNTGLTHARGAYLKFLDSDDYLHPEQIAWQMQALAGRADHIAITGVRLFRDGHPEEYLDQVSQAKALLPELFGDVVWGGIHAFLFPAPLLQRAGGFDESYRYHEDWEWLTRLGLCEPHLLIDPRIGAYYRLRGGSMSSNRAAMALARAWALLRLHELLRSRNRPDWFGKDLFESEQFTYHMLVKLGVRQPLVLRPLLQCLLELRARHGPGMFGWRFHWLVRLLGYERAEAWRCWIGHLLGTKPQETLDTAAWRQ